MHIVRMVLTQTEQIKMSPQINVAGWVRIPQYWNEIAGIICLELGMQGSKCDAGLFFWNFKLIESKRLEFFLNFYSKI